MKISELIEELLKVKQEHGDMEVVAQIDYFGGDYGGHSCDKTGAIGLVFVSEGKAVLNGDEC